MRLFRAYLAIGLLHLGNRCHRIADRLIDRMERKGS